MKRFVTLIFAVCIGGSALAAELFKEGKSINKDWDIYYFSKAQNVDELDVAIKVEKGNYESYHYGMDVAAKQCREEQLEELLKFLRTYSQENLRGIFWRPFYHQQLIREFLEILSHIGDDHELVSTVNIKHSIKGAQIIDQKHEVTLGFGVKVIFEVTPEKFSYHYQCEILSVDDIGEIFFE